MPAIHELLVDQVTAQGGVIGVVAAEDPVDLLLAVDPSGLELLLIQSSTTRRLVRCTGIERSRPLRR